MVCRRNGCRVSPVLAIAPDGVLRLDAVRTAPALCVFARNAGASETPRHQSRDRPLGTIRPLRTSQWQVVWGPVGTLARKEAACRFAVSAAS